MMANGGIMGRQPYQAGGGADYMEVTNPSPSQGKIEEIKQTNKILNVVSTGINGSLSLPVDIIVPLGPSIKPGAILPAASILPANLSDI